MNMNTNTESSSKKNRSDDSLYERMFVSVVTFLLSVMLCKLWYDHREELLQWLIIHDEEYRAQMKQKMNEVWQILLFLSTSILLKGYYRPYEKRKGSARLQYNYFLNVGFAIGTGVSFIIISDAIYMEGYIGLVARTILLLVLLWYFVEIRMLQKWCELMHGGFIQEGEILNLRHNINDREFHLNGRYKAIDIHLNGSGGVICVDENNNQIVDIPRASAVRAMIEEGSGDEYL
ncbi:hypothetical protein COLO4_19210 [Corchorus olitorius]|uniref:Uncharacterized protein n=1 Tax=Corchorus olitorius TaxID=93759 RepID=A0A1R3J6D1_9ROSI|nr:hypothetical protein COLO4_19210 [Corchorus olitorius]